MPIPILSRKVDDDLVKCERFEDQTQLECKSVDERTKKEKAKIRYVVVEDNGRGKLSIANFSGQFREAMKLDKKVRQLVEVSGSKVIPIEHRLGER